MTSPHPGNGTVLVLGGTGKTGSRITRLLEASSVPFLAASRSGAGDNGVKFDWMDRATWDIPFGAASPDAPITAVWLIGAPILEMAPLARDFIDLAREKGVRRFVFLSASSVECGGPVHGQVHQYLKELGDAGQIEWAVMRPTWFSGASTLSLFRVASALQVADDYGSQRTLPRHRATSIPSRRKARCTPRQGTARSPSCPRRTSRRVRSRP
jgi:uncharacterized protein YbjT (DUF2867 family)